MEIDLAESAWTPDRLAELERTPEYCNTLRRMDQAEGSRPGNLAWLTECTICGMVGPTLLARDFVHQSVKCANGCRDPRLWKTRKEERIADGTETPRSNGRAPKVFLEQHGVSMPVAWWAEFLSNGDPLKQKSIDNCIRQRVLQRERGVPLSDGEVIYGKYKYARAIKLTPEEETDVRLERFDKFAIRFREVAVESLSIGFGQDMRLTLAHAMAPDIADVLSRYVESNVKPCMDAALARAWPALEKELQVFLDMDGQDRRRREEIRAYHQSKAKPDEVIRAERAKSPQVDGDDDLDPPEKPAFKGWASLPPGYSDP